MSVSPLALAAAVAGCLFFARGFRRLRRRRVERAGWDRAALFGLAVVAGLVAMSGWLDDLAEESLAAHMLQHLLLADVAPALALVALRGPLAFFVLPGFLLRSISRSPRARACLSAVTRPAFALGFWLAILAFWHVPAVYGAALASAPLHVLEHLSFFVAGVLAWLQIVDPVRRGALSTLGRLGFLLVMFVAGQLLAMAIVLPSFVVYQHYTDVDGLSWLSPLGDQDAAGLVMMLEQALVAGIAAIILVRRHLEESSASAPRGASHPLAT